ncbi:hypothetical protein OROGR_029160 [Orobanche gracilis]
MHAHTHTTRRSIKMPKLREEMASPLELRSRRISNYSSKMVMVLSFRLATRVSAYQSKHKLLCLGQMWMRSLCLTLTGAP